MTIKSSELERRRWAAQPKKPVVPSRTQSKKTPAVKSKRHLDLLALRTGLKLSQSNFWGALGVTQYNGSRYERGRKLPKPVATLLDLVYVKRLSLQRIEACDMEIIRYLKDDQPDLYAALTKAISVEAASVKQS